MGEGFRASTPSECGSIPHLHLLTNKWWTWSGDFITQAWLIKSLAVGDQFTLQLLSLPRNHKGETESFHLLITWFVLQAPATPSLVASKSPHNITKRLSCLLLSLKKVQVLGALCQKQGEGLILVYTSISSYKTQYNMKHKHRLLSGPAKSYHVGKYPISKN